MNYLHIITPLWLLWLLRLAAQRVRSYRICFFVDREIWDSTGNHGRLALNSDTKHSREPLDEFVIWEMSLWSRNKYAFPTPRVDISFQSYHRTQLRPSFTALSSFQPRKDLNVNTSNGATKPSQTCRMQRMRRPWEVGCIKLPSVSCKKVTNASSLAVAHVGAYVCWMMHFEAWLLPWFLQPFQRSSMCHWITWCHFHIFQRWDARVYSKFQFGFDLESSFQCKHSTTQKSKR